MTFIEGYLLLIAFVLAWLYLRLAHFKKKRFLEYLTEQNFPYFFPKRSWLAFFARATCLVVAWILLSISFTNPVTRPNAPPKEGQITASFSSSKDLRPKIDEIAFVLDVSASMNATDTSTGSSRLDRAKEVIETICEDLGGINVSLLGFAGNAQVLVPETLDYLYFRILLDDVTVNDTGDAGTNLLAMCDAIKARYSESSYNKSVLVVLLTDGEDTGFLDVADSARKQAEAALLEYLSLTVSDHLHWEIVGFGTTSGAIVPNVTDAGKQVISRMQRALLEQMAQAGRGHFYAESDTPLTEIVDNLLAEVAGAYPVVKAASEAQSFDKTEAPIISLDILLLVIAASILILVALALPQQERQKA